MATTGKNKKKTCQVKEAVELDVNATTTIAPECKQSDRNDTKPDNQMDQKIFNNHPNNENDKYTYSNETKQSQSNKPSLSQGVSNDHNNNNPKHKGKSLRQSGHDIDTKWDMVYLTSSPLVFGNDDLGFKRMGQIDITAERDTLFNTLKASKQKLRVIHRTGILIPKTANTFM